MVTGRDIFFAFRCIVDLPHLNDIIAFEKKKKTVLIAAQPAYNKFGKYETV